MGSRKIGFLQEENRSKSKKEEVRIRDVENSFKTMISGLKLDETIYLQEIKLERKIRKELIKIYLRIKKLEKKIAQRELLSNQASSHYQDFPKKALDLLPEIEALDKEIMPEANKIQQEISKHTLADIAEIYKDIQLSDEQIKHVRTLANTLNATLTTSMKAVFEDVQKQQTDSMRRSILMRHPELG